MNKFRAGLRDAAGHEPSTGVIANCLPMATRVRWSHLGANDVALQAHTGLMSLTGEPDGPPARCGVAVIDLYSSLAMVSAILAALLTGPRPGRASGWRLPCCAAVHT